MTRAKKIDPAPWLLGALTKGKQGRHYLQPQHGMPPQDKFCNSRMPAAAPGEISKLMASPPRPGAEDHRQWQSFGRGC